MSPAVPAISPNPLNSLGVAPADAGAVPYYRGSHYPADRTLGGTMKPWMVWRLMAVIFGVCWIAGKASECPDGQIAIR